MMKTYSLVLLHITLSHSAELPLHGPVYEELENVAEDSRIHRSEEHVYWVREILRVRISKLDHDMRTVTGLLHETITINNSRINDSNQRRNVWRIIQNELHYWRRKDDRRLRRKHLWLRNMSIPDHYMVPGGKLLTLVINL